MQKDCKQYITTVDEGYELEIAVNEKCGDYTVTGIFMFVNEDADEGCGDLAVSYDIGNLTNNEEARTVKGEHVEMLLRDMHSDDEVTRAMKHFYWDDAFTDRLCEILADCGFANSNASTSEWGMQDEGSASYDAFDLADEIRTIMQAETA